MTEDNKKVSYGVIHEVGEYAEVQPLSEQDNETVNRTDEEEKE